MPITNVSADTGGGNFDVVLPDRAEILDVTAMTGAGNVTVEAGRDLAGSSTIHANSGAGNVLVRIPSGVAARIHTTCVLGQAIIDPRLNQMDNRTYQSPD